jgi:ankyrin repeat protein
VRVLLEQGDLRPADPELRDALLHAGDPEVVELLIEHGAALDARDREGRTPYMRAARFKNPATMRLLAAAGASTEVDPAAEWVGAIVRGEHEHAARLRAQHPAALLEGATERTGIVRETELSYLPGRPVRISLRRRGIRYDIDDMGAAVAIAGRPAGWLEAADRVVKALGWNVNRQGVVFVQATEGRDIDALVRRTAEASTAVLEALLALDE